MFGDTWTANKIESNSKFFTVTCILVRHTCLTPPICSTSLTISTCHLFIQVITSIIDSILPRYLPDNSFATYYRSFLKSWQWQQKQAILGIDTETRAEQRTNKILFSTRTFWQRINKMKWLFKSVRLWNVQDEIFYFIREIAKGAL